MYNKNTNVLSAIIQSPISPRSTNVLWDDMVSNTLKVYRKGIWTVIGGAGGGGGEGSSLYWGYDAVTDVLFPLERKKVQINNTLTVNGDIRARKLSVEELTINGEDFTQYWELDPSTNTLYTNYQVKIGNNLIVEGDTSSGGTGQDTPSAGLDEEQLQNYLDLHKYVNEGYVNDAITALNLSQYAKGSDLDALQAEVDNIDAVLGLSETAEGYINTWAEVKAFLDGYKNADDLATILSGINADIAKNAENIATLDNDKADKATTLAGYGITDAYTKSDLESYKTWWDAVMGLVVKDGNNIRIKTNLIVEGDTSSGGSGQDTPASGTVTGIKVSASETLTPNNAGIIDMVSVLSSIDVSDQLTAYAKTEDVNAALLTKQDTISDLATIRDGASKGATALQSITKNMVDSVLGSTTAGNANRFLMSTGSTSVWAAISDYALPLSGGFMNNNASIKWYANVHSWDNAPDGLIGVSMVSDSLGYYGGLSFKGYYGIQIRAYGGDTDDISVRGYNASNWGAWHTLLHSGNYSDYALRLSGNQYYRFADSAGNTGFLTQDTSQNNTWYIVGKTNDYNVLLHSGNIGSQSVANAQRLLSPYSYPSNVITNTTTADSLFSESYSFSAMQEDHPLFGYATIWNFSAYLKFGATQLAAHYNALTPRLALRNYNQNVSGWSEWREFAFLDDNVASATKLANNSAFYAWGQMFFNNGVPQDANGYMLFNNGDIIHAKDANGSEQYVMGLTSVLSLGYGTSASGIDTYIEGNNVYLRYGTSHATGLTLNSSGNVTFGGRDLAGNVRKLVVDGSSEIAVLTQHPSNLAEIDRNKAFSVTYSPSNDYGLHIWLNDDGTTNMQSAYASSYYGAFNLSLQPLGGNVLIGTATDSGYKLDVNGDSRINGNLVVSGDTSSGSDIRFKDIIKNKTLKIEHIAKAPLFTFKWNDREDDSIHMGSSAQYWENIAPWLVSGSEFKSLNYATLGVAMGISLAKKAVNHEERIKVLEKEIKRLKEEMIHG